MGLRKISQCSEDHGKTIIHIDVKIATSYLDTITYRHVAGVTGIPELECTQCHSLFHPKCVGIPQWQVANIQGKFRCKVCADQNRRR